MKTFPKDSEALRRQFEKIEWQKDSGLDEKENLAAAGSELSINGKKVPLRALPIEP